MPQPPRPDPPDHSVRIAIEGTFEAATWANVLWVRNGGASTPSTGSLQAICQEFNAQYAAKFLPLLSTNLHMHQVEALYYGPGGDVFGAVVGSGSSGQSSGSVMPANVACCISWKVRQRYRGGHPRTYLSGIPADVVTSATDFLPAFADAVRVAADQFHAAINAFSDGALTDCHLGTVSFVLDKAWRHPPVFRDYTPAAALVDGRIDTQRRRLGRDR